MKKFEDPEKQQKIGNVQQKYDFAPISKLLHLTEQPILKGMDKLKQRAGSYKQIDVQQNKTSQDNSEETTDLQAAIFEKKQSALVGHVGNCKDFISGIHNTNDFELKHINLYRKMQPFPLRGEL